jgi:SAM-dependent methyltransferase
MTGSEYIPFKWKFENLEVLSFADNSFDYVIIHDSLHHTSSPHRALNEMYRVGKKGILAIESRDSFVMRCFEKYGFTQVYEHGAVYYNDCKYGGVNNTEIPNFIYRWTEREIEKTIHAYAPHSSHTFVYRYGTAFPYDLEKENNGDIKSLFLKIMRPLYWLFVKVFPRQQNSFAFYISKPTVPESLKPWLGFNNNENKITFDKKWGDEKYKQKSLMKSNTPRLNNT